MHIHFLGVAPRLAFQPGHPRWRHYYGIEESKSSADKSWRALEEMPSPATGKEPRLPQTKW